MGQRTIPREGNGNPLQVLLPGKSHGWRSLVGCSPWGLEKSDTTKWLHFHFSLSCIGEGNGNPLQCSCLENPRDGGAWWAAIYGVAQSWTWLKQFSSSSRELSHVHRLLNLELLGKEILFCLSYFCFRLLCFISLGCNFMFHSSRCGLFWPKKSE